MKRRITQDGLTLPLVEFDDGDTLQSAAQREYVAAMNSNIGFTAHRHWWHYLVERKTIVSLRMTSDLMVHTWLKESARTPHAWIDQAMEMAAREERR